MEVLKTPPCSAVRNNIKQSDLSLVELRLYGDCVGVLKMRPNPRLRRGRAGRQGRRRRHGALRAGAGWPRGGGRRGGGRRARSHCRSVLAFIHFIPGSLTYHAFGLIWLRNIYFE
jgi:hypothetical protein